MPTRSPLSPRLLPCRLSAAACAVPLASPAPACARIWAHTTAHHCRLQASAVAVQRLPTPAPDFHRQPKGAPLGEKVYATRAGAGQRKVLLVAHMDTVYAPGIGAKQPFRSHGDKAYSLGIADEEIGSPGSAAFLTQRRGEHDAVLSFEGGGSTPDRVRLATSSIAIVVELRVTGKASHAGASLEAGCNALYELAHQILKTRNLGNAEQGLRINWTLASAGATRNVIPASASAIADVRSLTNDDLDRIEAALRAAIQDKRIPDTRIALDFYRSRPAFKANAVSAVLAQHAQAVSQQMG